MIISENSHQHRHQRDEHWMQHALLCAKEAALNGEIPVGAVLVDENDQLLAAAGNSPIGSHDPTAHAEIITLRRAAEQRQNYRLVGTTIFVTLEPCIMCMGALIHARIERLVYGAADPKTGAAFSVYSIGNDRCLNHQIDIRGGVLAGESSALLKSFFRSRRKVK